MAGTWIGNADAPNAQTPDGHVMTKRQIQPLGALFRVLLLGVLLLSVAACRSDSVREEDSVRPIPNGLLYPLVPESEKFVRYHPVEYSAPIAHVQVLLHPFMAPNIGNNMHCDAYMTDTYEASGPLGLNPQITSRTQGFGGYGTIGYDSQGRLVAVHSNGGAFQLELMDPYTLEELASYDLPGRPWYWILQGVLPWEYLGAGMYFYLDDEYRAIVPTTDNTLRVVQVPGPENHGQFTLVREYDLAEYVVPLPWPKEDSVAWVLPEWSGDYYWYATTEGMIGTVDVESGTVRTRRLAGEVVENSFAVGEDGVYVLSDRALYRFSHDNGNIVVDWRTEYDRGPRQKPGHITRGSGTTVTLLGGADGLVVITDNAEPRINFERYVLFRDIPEQVLATWTEVYLGVLRKVTLQMGGRRLALKNPANTGRIGALLNLFPSAKFIHIYRSPYDVFLSTMWMQRSVIPRSQVQDISPDQLEAHVLRFYVQLQQKYLAEKDLIPAGNLAEVRFEALEKDPLTQLHRVYEELSLPGYAEAEPAFRAYLASTASYQKNRYDLNDGIIAKVNRHWQFAFDEWGYERLDPSHSHRSEMAIV